MRLIALTGKAGAGKDTFADRLVDRHGFVKRGFADPLYEEVASAFGVSVHWLRDRTRKEAPQVELALRWCENAAFSCLMSVLGHKDDTAPRSPRFVLQHWGTEFRRAESETYWLNEMARYLSSLYQSDRDAKGVVFPDCRFLNEGHWVCANGGAIVRIVRPGVAAVNAHVSEIPLPDEMIERTVHNHGSISYLHSVADSAARGAERIERRA